MTDLLLLSWGDAALPGFLTETLGRPTARFAYVGDAARRWSAEPWARTERDRLTATGHDVVDLTLTGSDRAAVGRVLADVDALYVAGGNTFELLEAMQTSGTKDLIADAVRGGLPYVGLSAGSVITGPDVRPVELLDDPADAPLLTDTLGLGLVDVCVIPHAGGTMDAYPPAIFEATLARHGEAYPLLLFRDDQAIRVDAAGHRVIPS